MVTALLVGIMLAFAVGYGLGIASSHGYLKARLTAQQIAFDEEREHTARRQVWREETIMRQLHPEEIQSWPRKAGESPAVPADRRVALKR